MTTLLPPVQLYQGKPSTITYHYEEDGEPFDFTGYTGSWRIEQDKEDVAIGAVTLTLGHIVFTVTADQVERLVPASQYRGRVVGACEITITDGTDILIFQAAVSVWRAV